MSLAAHYAAVAALLPLPIFGAAVLLSGLMSATIVTVSHQTEDLILDREPDWVLNQFVSTRDCRTSNPFSEWLWGGMQYQLIHHLMPTLPRYHYRKIRPLVRAFAKENGVEYREMDELPLLARNIALYRDVARAPADPTAVLERRRVGVRKEGMKEKGKERKEGKLERRKAGYRERQQQINKGSGSSPCTIRGDQPRHTAAHTHTRQTHPNTRRRAAAAAAGEGSAQEREGHSGGKRGAVCLSSFVVCRSSAIQRPLCMRVVCAAGIYISPTCHAALYRVSRTTPTNGKQRQTTKQETRTKTSKQETQTTNPTLITTRALAS